jgi:hypothetical protein
MNTLQLPGPRQMRADHRAALRQELEAIAANPAEQSRWRRGVTGSLPHRVLVVAVAAVILVVFFVPLPHISLFRRLVAPATVTNGALPVVDLSATPAGWVPVAFGDSQISVPEPLQPRRSEDRFIVLYGAGQYCSSVPLKGTLYVGSPLPESGCSRTVVALVPLPHGPRNYLKNSPSHVNGVPVYLATDAGAVITWYVPSLSVELTARGPLAERVLHTLTRSPLDVVLAPGPAPTVPSSWRSGSFDGISFSVPNTWHTLRTSDVPGFAGCSRSEFLREPVVLSTDEKMLVFSCPAPAPEPEPALNGLEVDEGPQERPVSVASTCLNLSGLRACPATGPTYTLLVYQVIVPGRTKPVIVSIGLSGNGIVARTILYSLRAA